MRAAITLVFASTMMPALASAQLSERLGDPWVQSADATTPAPPSSDSEAAPITTEPSVHVEDAWLWVGLPTTGVGVGFLIAGELGRLNGVDLAITMTTGLSLLSLGVAFLVEWLLEVASLEQRREQAARRRRLESGAASAQRSGLAFTF